MLFLALVCLVASLPLLQSVRGVVEVGELFFQNRLLHQRRDAAVCGLLGLSGCQVVGSLDGLGMLIATPTP